MSEEKTTPIAPADALFESAPPAAPVEAPAAPVEAKPAPVEVKAAEPVTLLTPGDLVFPDGIVKDEPVVKSFLEVMNDAMLAPKDRANKLIDLQAQASKQMIEGYQKQWDEIETGWIRSVEADPDIGGTKLPAVLGSISQLLDKYGGPETREAFNITHAGNNPAVVKFLHNISKVLNEPRAEPFAPRPPGTARPPEQVLFGDK